MSILITGATGLLGSSLVERLRKNHDLLCLVRNIADNSRQISFIEHDLSKPLDHDKLPDKIDAVVHLAQSSDDRTSSSYPTDVFNLNIFATFQLLEYAKKAKAEYFLYASTGSVYDGNYQNASENDALSPVSEYAATKLAGEVLVKSYSGYFDTCIMRLFFLYGRHQKKDRLIARVYDHIKNGTPIYVNDDGGLIFTPTYSDDVAIIIEEALQEKWQGCYNIASPEIVTLKDVSLELGKLLGKEPVFEVLPNNMQPKIIPNLNRLKQRYTPMKFTPLDQGLRFVFAER
jgi:UDP-glucose 4-epimerase